MALHHLITTMILSFLSFLLTIVITGLPSIYWSLLSVEFYPKLYWYQHSILRTVFEANTIIIIYSYRRGDGHLEKGEETDFRVVTQKVVS